jgi:hypothetical protein
MTSRTISRTRARKLTPIYIASPFLPAPGIRLRMTLCPYPPHRSRNATRGRSTAARTRCTNPVSRHPADGEPRVRDAATARDDAGHIFELEGGSLEVTHVGGGEPPFDQRPRPCAGPSGSPASPRAPALLKLHVLLNASSYGRPERSLALLSVHVDRADIADSRRGTARAFHSDRLRPLTRSPRRPDPPSEARAQPRGSVRSATSSACPTLSMTAYRSSWFRTRSKSGCS